MADDRFEVDVLIVGGGMGGLTVAAGASELGATVAVVERGTQLGGSAALSEGYVWTAPNPETFLEQDPQGDLVRFEAMRRGLDESLEWVNSLGVEVGPVLTGVLGYGAGRQIDIAHYIQRARAIVESAGGWIILGTSATELLCDTGRVTGCIVKDIKSGDSTELYARNTVLATGGFQASKALRDEYLFPGASRLVLRSNRISDGAGLRLGLQVGAAPTRRMDGFYGHLVPYPICDFVPSEFALLAQYHSEHGLLLARDGRRFCDESLGDHVNTEEVARIDRALLIIDERIRREHVLQAFIPGMDVVDKMAEAGRRGGQYASEESLEGLADVANSWGYMGAGILKTVTKYNAAIVNSGAGLEPARARNREPIIEPPFAAAEVQAAITYTYGGLSTDRDGHVLDADGRQIGGLFAAGVDAGGLNVWGYTGGLVQGLVLGRRVAQTLATPGDEGAR